MGQNIIILGILFGKLQNGPNQSAAYYFGSPLKDRHAYIFANHNKATKQPTLSQQPTRTPPSTPHNNLGKVWLILNMSAAVRRGSSRSLVYKSFCETILSSSVLAMWLAWHRHMQWLQAKHLWSLGHGEHIFHITLSHSYWKAPLAH